MDAREKAFVAASVTAAACLVYLDWRLHGWIVDSTLPWWLKLLLLG